MYISHLCNMYCAGAVDRPAPTVWAQYDLNAFHRYKRKLARDQYNQSCSSAMYESSVSCSTMCRKLSGCEQLSLNHWTGVSSDGTTP